MEILIILVIMAVASVLVYMQLKGTKPEVVPVMDLPKKKKSPKSAPVEKKIVENWDKEETKSASPSPDSKKKGKKRFDPVQAGQEMVATKKVEESALRERKHMDESESKKEEKKARKQGFVMVEEKKVTTRRVVQQVETVVEENDTVARLKAILSGNKPPAPEGLSDKPKPKPVAKEPISHDEIAKKLREQKEEQESKKAKYNAAAKGGTVKVAAGFTISQKKWGEVPAAAPVKEEEPKAEEEEETPADEE